MSAPSPTPSNMPPPNLKRPRPSAAGAAGSSAAAAAGAGGGGGGPAPRTKRRKPEAASAVDAENAGDKRSFGVGMVKGREEEWGEPGEVRTKIDFNDLPVETLYRYLEYHDLLPRWDVSPWSEEPCTPPTQLYTLPPPSAQQPSLPLFAQEPLAQDQHNQCDDPAQTAQNTTTALQSAAIAPENVPVQNGNGNGHDDGDVTMADSVSNEKADTAEVGGGESAIPGAGAGAVAHPDPAAVTTAGLQLDTDPSNPSVPIFTEISTGAEEDVAGVAKKDTDNDHNENGENGEAEGGPTSPSLEETLETEPEPPTTRSKTLPTRKPPTPSPAPSLPPQPSIKRGVITLSDVYAAREALAEKANAHWMKGLGGGQNKEGETIVNFLYKMKVGQGRLLRVYNPSPSQFPGW